MKEFFSNRFNILGIFCGLLAAILVVQVINLQVINGEYYSAVADRRGYSSTVIGAPRGEITDKFGRVIATNRTTDIVIIRDIGLKDKDLNLALYDMIKLAEKIDKPYVDTLPLTYTTPVQFTFETKEQEKAWKNEWKIDEGESAREVYEFLKEKYEVKGFDEGYTRKLVGLRFDLRKNNFSDQNPYKFISDVDIETISEIKENKNKYICADVQKELTRDYPGGNTCAHMLGYVGLIDGEEYALLKESGYGIKDYVGKSGLEKYLESELKGTDGRTGMTVDVNGVKTVVSEEVMPIPGNKVMLTLDLDVQKAAEKALAETVESMSDEDNSIGGGAAVAIDVKTGAVLAMASYPDYNPVSFNKDYNKLIEDKKNPIYNRALVGTYSPGSTFKPLVALAGLQEGVITGDETIDCTGRYTYYAPDYSPSCWIYGYHGGHHGELGVEGAIENSCNVYFFETGRRLQINTINRYAKMFGFGEGTGIEIAGESKGIVAGPENRKEGEKWYPADTIQAAIGQSDNKFTILQLANYCATIANKGQLRRPYIVNSVVSGVDGKVIKTTKPEVIREIDINDEYWDIVHRGMLAVTTEGSTAPVFKDATYSVAGKTGTAQTSSSKNDSLFICYAPYDDPQIAVACIIENGGIQGEGNNVVKVAREMMDSYFSKGETSEETLEYNSLVQ